MAAAVLKNSTARADEDIYGHISVRTLHLENCIPTSNIKKKNNSISSRILNKKRNEKAATATLGWLQTRSSKKGHKVDALALRADERRDKLR